MTKNAAMMLILLGGSCMSFVGLMMRLLETGDALVILFYRSIGLVAMVTVIACLRRRVLPMQFLASLDKADVMMGVALGLAFVTYVFAMLMTSVASTLFLLTTSPFLAAIIGWVWIGERPHAFTWWAMLGAMIGVGVMLGDGWEMGRTLGNIVALISALAFSVMLVLARRNNRGDVLGGTFLGGIFAGAMAGAAALLIGDGLSISTYDLGMTLSMGAFTIGIGIAFVTWGTSYVPAAETSLLVLIESVLGPIWPWVFLGESMSKLEITGGAVVMAAVALLALTSLASTSHDAA
jgi:drug/metabolite transporter (DMT)-like permease